LSKTNSLAYGVVNLMLEIMWLLTFIIKIGGMVKQFYQNSFISSLCFFSQFKCGICLYPLGLNMQIYNVANLSQSENGLN
jgi:hypothetical protein